MPELPEVENVRVSLRRLGIEGQHVNRVELKRAGLRKPFPAKLDSRLRGQKLTGIRRRAKYLLFETEDYFLISHLGMTGAWRVLGEEPLQKHDHAILHFESGLKLVFNDPRRFGVLDLVEKAKLERNRWFKHLGIEPLEEQFSGEFLFTHTRRLKGPLKGFLMDQRRVVGVGNIYASEALFAAGIKPKRASGRLTRDEADALASHVRRILTEAIDAGGSTIRDYRNSEGVSGSFQQRFKVYDRAGEECPRCGGTIKSAFIAGRNTYWCPKCQR
jgi:formamidopyrimidine-DNA glycosylase